jgi:uncharacterized membrane protein YphA (DoxX/SURF4 family)
VSWLRHPLVVRASGIAIGVVFAWAALAKLGDLRAFADQIHNFRLVPIFAENLLAFSLPWIELMAALALLLNFRPRSGALVVTSLLAVFTVAVVVAMIRGLDFECGCFGTADGSRVGAFKVVQNLGLLALGAIASLRAD